MKPVNVSPVLETCSPADLGLPAKFTAWRPSQLAAISAGMESSKRFVAHAMPTGSGKSLVYIAEALARGCRVCVCTATKGLQEQLLKDFSQSGMVQVMGRANFTCLGNPERTCEDGSHAGCRDNKIKTGSSCPYRQQYEAAMKAKLVVTNYAYWCAINRYAEGLGRFDMLVLDEAHDAAGFVCDVVNVHMTQWECMRVLTTDWPKYPQAPSEWSIWAKKHIDKARSIHDDQAARCLSGVCSKADLDRLLSYKRLINKLDQLIHLRGEWAVDKTVTKNGEEGYKIQLVWPKEYAEEVLFYGIENVRLISATMLPKTVQMLGVKHDEYNLYDYDSFFPGELSPVYFIPTVKLNYKSGDTDYYQLVSRIDEILDGRDDRKGIIHTVSYKRAQQIMSMSSHSHRFMLNSSRPGDAMRVVEQFKRDQGNAVLVTPSVTTGYDFPYSECEFQIIAKAPFPDMQSSVMTARMEKDKSYLNYEMAMTLVQSTGRGTRADDDQCENFVLDDAVLTSYKRFPGHYPLWWRELVQECVTVPDAPPRIEREEF